MQNDIGETGEWVRRNAAAEYWRQQSVCKYRAACQLCRSLSETGLRVTTCLEYLEMSESLTAVRERKCQGKNLVREKLPKTVYCKLQAEIWCCSTSTCWLLCLHAYDVGRGAREAGEVRGQGNTTYHFHFQALVQQIAVNTFLTQSSGYTRLLSSIVCTSTSQAGRRAGGA